MTTTAVVAPQRPEVGHTPSPVKAAWRRFGTPVLVLLMALAIALTMTRNWNAWEGGRAEQVTNDAYIRRDLTPLSTKVIGLVREVKVNDYQRVRKGDELVLLADDDYRAQVCAGARRGRRGEGGTRKQSPSARTPGRTNSTGARRYRPGHRPDRCR